MNTNKKQYLYLVLTISVFFSIFIYRVTLYSYYLSFKNGDHVSMHQSVIPIRNGFDIRKDKNSLTIFNPIKDRYMIYFRWPLTGHFNKIEDINKFYKKNGVTIKSSEKKRVNNVDYFVITYISKSKKTTISMYSPDHNMIIEYIGPGTFYDEFIGVIREIEFTRPAHTAQ